jgi:hypothetical protein
MKIPCDKCISLAICKNKKLHPSDCDIIYNWLFMTHPQKGYSDYFDRLYSVRKKYPNMLTPILSFGPKRKV